MPHAPSFTLSPDTPPGKHLGSTHQMLAFSSGRETIGNDADASAALARRLEFVGDGLFKRVYRSPDGSTVYKVPKLRSPDLAGTAEGRAAARQCVAEAAFSAQGIANGTPGIPPVSVYIVDGRQVLAMPFYPKDAYEIEDRDTVPFRAWSDLGIEDLHEGNYRADAAGVPFCTDLAGWAGQMFGGAYPSDMLPDTLAPEDGTDGDDDEDGEDRDECYTCRERDEDEDPSEATPTPAPSLCGTRWEHCRGKAYHNGASLVTRMAEHEAHGARVGAADAGKRATTPVRERPRTAPGQVAAW